MCVRCGLEEISESLVGSGELGWAEDNDDEAYKHAMLLRLGQGEHTRTLIHSLTITQTFFNPFD